MIRQVPFIVAALLIVACGRPVDSLSDRERLGLLIFTDSTLSTPVGQSCSSCHEVGRGFADPQKRVISEGAVKGLFSNRNSMSVAYSVFVPELHYDSVEQVWAGGLFWDGRSGSLAHQAGQPFINKLEMGNFDTLSVVNKVRGASYFGLLQRLYGENSSPDSIFSYLIDALAAYQSSGEVSPFSSRFDDYLAGKIELTADEKAGLELFANKALCAECHLMTADPLCSKVLFTDHTYDNLGIPKNMDSPYLGIPLQHNPQSTQYIDLGLGPIVSDSAHNGKFRVPTLRNIALTAPYGHNGYFATLEQIVHFYNVRDSDPSAFAVAEYPATVNTEELGSLGLTPNEERQIVVFMHTLSDR